ncbi:MAG: cyclase family protein [Armatimonadota bacterium]
MKKIIDLTHKITNNMPVFPGDPKVEIDNAIFGDKSAYNVSIVKMGSHTGTHIDAPSHLTFLNNGLQSISLSKLIGIAEVIDLGNIKPDSIIEVSQIIPHIDRIKPNGKIILKTNWSRYWNTPDYFLSYPSISIESAELFADRDIDMLAIEQPSTHQILHEQIHSILLSKGIIILENLANTSEINADTVYLTVLPLNIENIDGSPVRAVAVVYPESVMEQLEQA